MGAGKKQTIGYRYYFSLHMGIGRGPLNEIAEVRVGDLTATDAPINIANGGVLTGISKPELFGGDKKEGGVQGPMYVYNGARDQVLQPAMRGLPSIAASLGGDVPSFRGIVSLWFDGMVCAMNPYPKEWSFRVRRSTAGWWENNPWNPATALIPLTSESGKPIHAMNGAHIIYEVNTNPEWGRGMPPELIDEASFIRAANQLYEEGLGLCLPWFRQETIKEFLPVVVNHIGGVQYVDRETGKLALKLIRGDYNVLDLPLFTPDTGLLDILDDDSSGEETSYNEIIVKGFDPTTKEDISVRVQNLASIQSQEEIISNTVEYKGLATRDLCSRVALRELKVQLPLRRMTVLLDRRGWRIQPGMAFRISYPERGIENMVLRAGECNDGTLVSGKISIKAVQDIFGMPTTSFVTPEPGGWTPPNFDAVPPPETRLYELNWRDYYIRSAQADRDAVDLGTSFIAEMAMDPPNSSTQGFDIATKLSTEPDFVMYLNGGFTAWLKLGDDLQPLDDMLTVAPENRANFAAEYVAGMVVLIDDEQLQFVSFNEDTGIAVLLRGVADTIPAPHTEGATIWLVDDEMVSDNREYQDGEIVQAKALTRTSTDLLELDEAETDVLEVNQRVFRPYPPANVKVGGVSIYEPLDTQTEAAVTWAHRDRIMQQDVAIGHLEASVGPETGVTYNIRIYGPDGVTLLSETDVGAVDNWTFTTARQVAAGSPSRVFIELESKRDGVASQQHYRFEVVIASGWGYDWGQNYGGAA